MQQVADWLEKLGLGQYAQRFAENDISFSVLPDLTDQHLREIGVSLGHRLQLLRAIAELTSREKDAPQAVAAAAPTALQDTAERRQVTVMFSDLVGSTALSARMDPEDLREVISVYQKCVAETVRPFGGFVAKYMGDGVLMYFGYPHAHEDDAERAARAGLALIEAAGKLGSAEPLQIRIGVATGLVVVGDLVGSGAAQEQAIVGETPNLAARLQAAAAPSTLVIDPTTRRLLAGLFEYLDLGAIEAKGFTNLVQAYEVVRPSTVESRFEALRTAMTPLVGREEEIELLMRRWARAKSGEGCVVLISGEPGIGKSRIAHTIVERLGGEAHTRLRYFCSPQHADSALYPIISQMERAAGLTRDDTPEAKLDKLDVLLAQTSTSPQDAVFFAELLSLQNDGRYPTIEPDPQRRRQRTLEALTSQVQRLTLQKPVLMIFEDAHWTDPTSLEVFGRVVDRIKTLRGLLIVTFRPEFQAPWIGRPHVTALNVNRFAERDVSAMIDHVVGKKLLSASIRQEIMERTDGIPLFVEELSKAAVEASPPSGDGKATIASISGPVLAAPATLQASLMARLDRLGSAAKEVAQIGAVIGREFSYELLIAVTRRTGEELEASLRRLTEAGLVLCQGPLPQDTFMFKHALVRDAAYDSLLIRSRRYLHGRICDVLEPQGGTAFEVLAEHCAGAGRHEAAVRHCLQAAETALARSANLEATRLIDRGLATLQGLPESPERNNLELKLLVQQGVARQALQGYGAPEVLAIYDRARALCRVVPDAPELIPVLRGLYVHHLMRGNLRSAHDFAEQLLRLADRAGDDGWRLEARFAFGQTLAFHLGDFRRARDVLAEGESIYRIERHGRHAFIYGQDPGVYCLALGGLMHWLLGRVDSATGKLERAIEVADAVGHALSRAAARAFATQLLQWRREVMLVRRMATETLMIAEEHGLAFFAAWARMNRAWAMTVDGEVERGRMELGAAHDSWEVTAGELLLPYVRCLLAEAHTRAGEAERGLALIPAALDMAERNGDALMLAEMHRLAGDILKQLKRLSEAEASYRRAIGVAHSQGAVSLELRAALGLARLWAERGERKRAHDLVAPLYDGFTEGLGTPDLVEAKCLADALG